LTRYFVEAGAMAVRRCKKSDLKRIAKCTGAEFLSSLANLDGEESFEAAYLGALEFRDRSSLHRLVVFVNIFLPYVPRQDSISRPLDALNLRRRRRYY
jgi:hypothetical protein